jgi:alkylhydroperoxidase family enzyme
MTGPRIPPGTRADVGAVNWTIARAIGAATGGGPPNVFTTLGRHRALFRRWLRFAAGLMPGGVLPRADTELVILRVAHNCGSDYEWRHHERLARDAGLTAADVERARAEDPAAPGWSPRQTLLLRAADELHANRTMSDELWTPLRAELSEREAIELCLLIGHYEMLAMTLNALRVQPDPEPLSTRRGGPVRLVEALARRRRGGGR